MQAQIASLLSNGDVDVQLLQQQMQQLQTQNQLLQDQLHQMQNNQTQLVSTVEDLRNQNSELQQQLGNESWYVAIPLDVRDKHTDRVNKSVWKHKCKDSIDPV